jgi:uncharacterized integral membrane protein
MGEGPQSLPPSGEPAADPVTPDGPTAQPMPTHARATAIPSTRTSRTWMRVFPVLVLMAIILVFVFQNLHNVRVSIFTFSGSIPLAVALLVSVALGALVVLGLGSVRIMQLRKLVRRSRNERAEPPISP